MPQKENKKYVKALILPCNAVIVYDSWRETNWRHRRRTFATSSLSVHGRSKWINDHKLKKSHQRRILNQKNPVDEQTNHNATSITPDVVKIKRHLTVRMPSQNEIGREDVIDQQYVKSRRVKRRPQTARPSLKISGMNAINMSAQKQRPQSARPRLTNSLSQALRSRIPLIALSNINNSIDISEKVMSQRSQQSSSRSPRMISSAHSHSFSGRSERSEDSNDIIHFIPTASTPLSNSRRGRTKDSKYYIYQPYQPLPFRQENVRPSITVPKQIPVHSSISDPIWSLILSYLSGKGLYQCSLCSKRFYKLVINPSFMTMRFHLRKKQCSSFLNEHAYRDSTILVQQIKELQTNLRMINDDHFIKLSKRLKKLTSESKKVLKLTCLLLSRSSKWFSDPRLVRSLKKHFHHKILNYDVKKMKMRQFRKLSKMMEDIQNISTSSHIIMTLSKWLIMQYKLYIMEKKGIYEQKCAVIQDWLKCHGQQKFQILNINF